MSSPLSRSLLLLLGISLLSGCATFSVPMQRDDFGLHFVPVRVNGHPGVFLVDSGASHTVVDHRFAARSLTNLTPSNLRLAWLGSQHHNAMQGVASDIQVGSYRQIGPYRIHVLNLDAINDAPARVQTMRMDGILGADFFITHKALIDYSTGALRFQSASNTWMEAPSVQHR